MKLWLKVSLITVIIIILATSICSTIIVIYSGKSNLGLAVQYALTDQQMRSASWSAAMENAMKSGAIGEYSPSAKRSLARYLIKKFADENTILISDNDFIYNATQIDPKEFLPVDGTKQQYIIQDIDKKTILFAGSNLSVEGMLYTLYVVKDISTVYDGIEKLSYQFVLINLIIVLIAGAIIVMLVRLVLRPISTLKKSTDLIAAGVYHKRIKINEKDEIGELAGNFNKMAAAVEARMNDLQGEADRRTMFMSALTHELKTPITSISGNAQTLLATKLDEDEREDALIRIHDECTRIERLSQKLMQFIVLQQKDDIILESLDMNTFLESVRASCQEQLNRRGLTLIISNDMDSLAMDKDLLSSLLINLIDNAGKASVKGNVVELSAEGNTITVKDHGKGIPSDELSKITQPFYMVDKSRSKKAGGIGLGLALAEKIAQLHDAALIFESVPSAGTTVKVVFKNV